MKSWEKSGDIFVEACLKASNADTVKEFLGSHAGSQNHSTETLITITEWFVKKATDDY